MSGQQAELGPQGRLPGLLIGFIGAILRAPAMAGYLSADRGGTARLQALGDNPRIEQPLAIPREMSSRSARVSEPAVNGGGVGGAIPP